jgi:hypothetical protein
MKNQPSLRNLILALVLLLQATIGTAQTSSTASNSLAHPMENTTWQLTADYILTDSQDPNYGFDVVAILKPTNVTIVSIASHETGGIVVSLALENGQQGYLIVNTLDELRSQLRPVQPMVDLLF